MTTRARTLHLRDRQSKLCRLRRIDVDFLLAHHAQHVDIAFTAERGVYRLTPRGCAGVIAAPTCRLSILPKLKWPNFIRLFDPDQSSLLNSPGRLDESPRYLPEFLAGHWLELVQQLVNAGLLCGYADRFDEISQVRGRLDLQQQLRSAPMMPTRFACHFDDFSTDIPCNRLVKSMLERLYAAAWLSPTLRQFTTILLEHFSSVESVEPPADACAKVLADLPAQAYHAVIELGQLLLHSPNAEAGQESPSSFLVDLERLFEHYITHGLQRHPVDPSFSLEMQPRLNWHENIAGQPSLQLRPDIVLRNSRNLDESHAVIDVKWKLFTGQPEAGDLHQIVAYATAAKAKRGILVYPGRRHAVRVYPLRNSEMQIEIATVRICGSDQQCARSLQRFTQGITRSLR
jgi:5-methylcytosine-specific restriction enzyme subunit McrC